MSTLIVPAAGPVSHHSGKPVWLLCHPSGQIVLIKMLKSLQLDNIKQIVVAVKPEHLDSFCGGDKHVAIKHVEEAIPQIKGRLDFHLVTPETLSGPDTIAQVVTARGVHGPIFIKDCDGLFPYKVGTGNTVVSLKIAPNGPEVNNLSSKSFLEHNGGLLTNIQEKHIISDCICVGGYSIASAEEFVAALNDLTAVQHSVNTTLGSSPRLFVSHVIHHMMLARGTVFTVDFITNFEDWKTEIGWRKFVDSHRNVLVALEGILFLPNRSVNYLHETTDVIPIKSNIEYLQKVAKRGHTRIVVTTSRPDSSRAITEQQLRDNGVPFDDVLYNMMQSTTLMINSYGEEIHHPSAIAYCVPVGSTQLGSVLHLD